MGSALVADHRRLCRCGAVLRMTNRTGRCWRCEDAATRERGAIMRAEASTGRPRKSKKAVWGRR